MSIVNFYTKNMRFDWGFIETIMSLIKLTHFQYWILFYLGLIHLCLIILLSEMVSFIGFTSKFLNYLYGKDMFLFSFVFLIEGSGLIDQSGPELSLNLTNSTFQGSDHPCVLPHQHGTNLKVLFSFCLLKENTLIIRVQSVAFFNVFLQTTYFQVCRRSEFYA